MPQLVPFYFVNQVLFGFVSIFLVTYFFAKWVLPRQLQVFVIWTYLASKL
uniref:ATP synthase protein 8 n=2 Tax=Pneumocystis jirovecii TaxID=42068 RepID=M1FW53_PNEJI|nr:ATP synthase subunit 8 [Pneumocystis jirovecii]AWB97801.1 ATP synthase F0 subunit 8 [Pneumocystis jirovecii]AWB97817.1 ATP synthase F0 subunit 8 [Pneumocystis jirovecii]AWB97832.1 ATP synthase F0 subunit 8 [Pneumocystis jirovecii]AWB97847.1 ATP synthase F0 subunit 8 [Pneumocystis jirovecii]